MNAQELFPDMTPALPAVSGDLSGGALACAWCGQLVPLATFETHTPQCERAVRNGQRSLFGGARGLFDEVEPC